MEGTRLVRLLLALFAVALLVGLLGIAGTARAEVPDAVTRLSLRRAVMPGATGTVPAPRPAPMPAPMQEPSEDWYLVELDSLVMSMTGGDTGALRLVDSAGEPVPTVILDRRYPEYFVEPVDANRLRWAAVEGKDDTFQAALKYPDDGLLVVDCAHELVGGLTLYRQTRGKGFDPIPAERPGHSTEILDGPASGMRRWVWRTPRGVVRLRVDEAKTGIPPTVTIARLVERPDRRRSVEFTTESSFRGNVFQQDIVLTGGPHAIVRIHLRRRADAGNVPVRLSYRESGGGWLPARPPRGPGAYKDIIDLGTGPVLAEALRLTFQPADPPNPPFEVVVVEEIPVSLAFPGPVAWPLWLVYDRHAVPSPPGPGRSRISQVRRFWPVQLGAPEPNPWFLEPALSPGWLQRRPFVLTLAMVAVLAVVALLVITDRRKPSPG